SIAKQETRYESRRARSRAPSTPPVWDGGRPRDPTPAGPDREAHADRSRVDARLRRAPAPTGPAPRAAAQTGALPRSGTLTRYLRFRFQQEDESGADPRAGHRPLHRATRGRAFSRATRDGQEPLGPGHRPRRDPTRLPGHLSR